MSKKQQSQEHTFVKAHDTTEFLNEYAPVSGSILAVARLVKEYGLTQHQAEQVYVQWYVTGEVTDVEG